MSGPDTCLYVIIATLETPMRWSRPFFVRAPSMAEAYIALIAQNRSMFQHPHVRFEGHVVSAGEMPDAKRIAKAWWALAYANANGPNHSSHEDFESLWELHGANPDEGGGSENT